MIRRSQLKSLGDYFVLLLAYELNHDGLEDSDERKLFEHPALGRPFGVAPVQGVANRRVQVLGRYHGQQLQCLETKGRP